MACRPAAVTTWETKVLRHFQPRLVARIVQSEGGSIASHRFNSFRNLSSCNAGRQLAAESSLGPSAIESELLPCELSRP